MQDMSLSKACLDPTLTSTLFVCMLGGKTVFYDNSLGGGQKLWTKFQEMRRVIRGDMNHFYHK